MIRPGRRNMCSRNTAMLQPPLQNEMHPENPRELFGWESEESEKHEPGLLITSHRTEFLDLLEWQVIRSVWEEFLPRAPYFLMYFRCIKCSPFPTWATRTMPRHHCHRLKHGDPSWGRKLEGDLKRVEGLVVLRAGKNIANNQLIDAN